MVASPEDLGCDKNVLKNRLNVFHRHGQPLPHGVTRGACRSLNTTTVDQFFRQFNGHTQVNATDLRSLRLVPATMNSSRLGEAARASGCAREIALDGAAAATIGAFASPIEARSA